VDPAEISNSCAFVVPVLVPVLPATILWTAASGGTTTYKQTRDVTEYCTSVILPEKEAVRCSQFAHTIVTMP
jgi:hypothetical protein